MELERAGLRQGHGPQVVDEALHDARLLEDRAQMLGVGRVDAIDHRLEVAGDDGQRRPELVADVGEERSTLPLIDLEPLDHRVEPMDELADRSWGPTGDLDADRIVAALDAAGRVDESIERARRTPDGPREADEDAEDDDDRDDPGHGPEIRDDRRARGDEGARDEEEDEPEQAAEAAPASRPLAVAPWGPVAMVAMALRTVPGRAAVSVPALARAVGGGHGPVSRSSASR